MQAHRGCDVLLLEGGVVGCGECVFLLSHASVSLMDVACAPVDGADDEM